MPRVTLDRAAHRVEPGAEARCPFDRDPVVSGACPVQLAVRQPPDQGALGEVTKRDVDLAQADVVPARECAAAGQPPARFPMDQRRRDPVSEHTSGADRRIAPGIAGVHAASSPDALCDGGSSLAMAADAFPVTHIRPLRTELSVRFVLRIGLPAILLQPHAPNIVRLYRPPPSMHPLISITVNKR